jgi:low temperature requirement protein LtrA
VGAHGQGPGATRGRGPRRRRRHGLTVDADRLADEPAEAEQQVTPLELFFDLVFVFAITQVTAFVSADPTWTRLVEGLAILTALWWAWESYV